MEPAVKVVLAGDFPASFTARATLKTGSDVASNRARRLVGFQSEASPQQAESLAAGERQFSGMSLCQF